MKNLLVSLALVLSLATHAQTWKFSKAEYRGAFGTYDWTAQWTNFDPQNTAYPATNATLSGDITSNMKLDAGKTYLLEGFVYVKNNATLIIPAGTIIRGDKATKGTLIITKSGKLEVEGTASSPVVFTSNEDPGDRDYGDWGGVIILGQAPVNPTGGTATIEGGVNNANNDGEYGGNDANHSSGSITHLRVEFPGIAFQPDNEINGITFGGVGAGTKLENIQVSYSGDDAFEWFGGNVNAKFLVSHRNWDDDFDCDYGFSGKVQFGLVLRDPNIADISGSNGFECDNDGTGSDNSPFTSATFANITIVGPLANSASPNSNYKRALHLRRNSRMNIHNSAFVGYPTGLLLDGQKTVDAFSGGTAKFLCNSIIECTTPLDVAGGVTFDIATWYNTSSFSNQILNSTGEAKFTNTSFTSPKLMPQAGSPLLTLPAGCLTPLGDLDFALSTKSPQNLDIPAKVYPNPTNSSAHLSFELEEAGEVAVQLSDMNGKTVYNNGKQAFSAGMNEVELNVSSLHAGMYFIRLESNTGFQTMKLNVVK